MAWPFSSFLDSTSYTIAQALFLRTLGVVYFLAFLSLFMQAKGLYGKHGILPIRIVIDSYKRLRKTGYGQLLPTVFWANSSDFFILLVCGTGVFTSILLTFGIWPPITLLILLALYLSFVVVGQDFLSFQWDTLLLEASYVALFFSLTTPPSPFLLLATWFLLFRLMFSSGIVKLLSNDPNWQSLVALKFHYETQPLPNRIAWHMHQMPLFFHKISALFMFAVELVVPFFIFGPETARVSAFIAIALFQLILIFTGNFSFLNFLTLALCIPLLSNSVLAFAEPVLSITRVAAPTWLEYSLGAVGLFFIFINLLHLLRHFFSRRWISNFLYHLSPIHLTSPYGLFAVMTTSRLELVIQGSNDGIEWLPYEFRYQPQNVYAPPKQIAPFHPRLDWQMWFAALRIEHLEPWLKNFMVALLHGSKDVLRLLQTNPFPLHPPKYIRVVVYDYHFTDRKTRKESGRWWNKELLGALEPMELRQSAK